VELESGFLPTPAGSAALSVSWRARSRQIRDHHRAQRRGWSRRYKRRLTLLQEGVSWLRSLLCSAPLRALDVVTQQGSGLSEIAFIHALLRQSRTRSARRYHGPYLVVANPYWFKDVAGTALVSSMGMFTSGASVGVPITPMTLSLCIGSIEKKLALLDGQVIEREVLHFNISIDHDIIDGAPLVRFAERFKKILLDGRALPARTAEPVRSLRDRLDVSERRADDDSSKATVRS
jgi:hypothetical protein